jgi:hypothetical protein
MNTGVEKAEQQQRESDPDAEEDGQRFVAPVARLHEAQAERAELLGRARRLLTDPLEQADQALVPRSRLGLVRAANHGQFFETALDGAGAARHQGHRARGDDQRPEEECEQGQEHRGHATPRS